MKKHSLMLGALLACVIGIGTSAAIAAAPSCPTITCGFNVGETHIFNGGTNDGVATAGVGVLKITGSTGAATISNVILNQNGSLQSVTVPLNGTCTATSATAGTLDFTSSSGPVFDYQVVASGNELRFIVPGTSTSPSGGDSPLIGVCTAATTLGSSCPASGTCQLVASGEAASTTHGPEALVGTLTFGGATSNKFTGTLNTNGTIVGPSIVNFTGGTCTVNNGIGTLDFSSGAVAVKVDFVASGGQYRLIEIPGSLDNSVSAGICVP